ncbi:unnamed protein product [Fraxinus pennsylvanica]|uniref:Uncharacterized protein n=1 Tax=Fraxinus pennsylvanica TaxID=56036 RepID=A0AAD1ZTR6_9LAMI|nr:unnamed protein product [Fraxinus pennsylvanica]
MGFSTGKSAAQVKEDMKRDFLPALILEGGVWPIVQVANFRYIPVRSGTTGKSAAQVKEDMKRDFPSLNFGGWCMANCSGGKFPIYPSQLSAVLSQYLVFRWEHHGIRILSDENPCN